MQPTVATAVFTDIFAIGNNVWLVANNATTNNVWYATDGVAGTASWTGANIGPGADFEAVHFISISASTHYGWIVGQAGKIYKSTDSGQSWSDQSLIAGAYDIYDVFALDASRVYACGASGKVSYTTDGGATDWTSVTLTGEGAYALRGIYMQDENTGWAIGQSGVGGKLYSTANKFSSFTTEIISSKELYGLRFYNQYNGWAVGGGSQFVAKYITNPDVATIQTQFGYAEISQGINYTLTITFQNSEVYEGATVSFPAGSGITVNSTTLTSATELSTSITVSGSATLGTVDMTVTNPDDGSSVKSSAVTIVARPTITSVTPASGKRGQYVDITLTGTGFRSGASITFSGSGISVVGIPTYVSNTQYTATLKILDSTSLGNQTLTLTNFEGGFATIPFTVQSAGTVPQHVETWINGSKYSPTIYPTGMDIDTDPRIVSIFVDIDDSFTLASVNAKLIADSETTRKIYEIPDSAVSLSSSNTRATISYTVPESNALGESVNSLTIYIENAVADGGSETIPVTVKFGETEISENYAYPNPWDPRSGDVDLQIKVSATSSVKRLKIIAVDSQGRPIKEFALDVTPGYNKFTWDGSTFAENYGGAISEGMVSLLVFDGNRKLGSIRLMVHRP